MPPPRLKRSNTAGAAPASLEDGEIAINQADGKLYYHTVAGGVSTFLTSAHKATHAIGGSDALSAADIGALTQATADTRYVNVTGDTMTGGLTINSASPLVVSGGRTFLSADSEPYGLGVRYVSSGGPVYFGATDGTATPGAQISSAGGTAWMTFTNAGAASIPGTLSVGGNAVVVTTDSRLSDARTPISHTHGNITNAGAIGTTSGLPVITTTSGVLTTGAFGTAAGSFCQGNDARLSDSRTPTSHTHAAADINVSATDRLLGRSTAGAGVVEEIPCTAFGRSVIAGVDAAAVRTTINAVSKGGDTISGAVTVTGAITGQTGLAISGGRSLCRAASEQYGLGVSHGPSGGYVYFGALSTHSTPDAVISNAGGVTLMTLQNGGNVGIGAASPATKLDVSGSVRASTGILFGTDTATANTLADYEEGTWTPTFTASTSNPTVTYATGTAGTYTKIGRLVFANANINLSAVSFAGTGSLRISGLPFSAASTFGTWVNAVAIARIGGWDTYAPSRGYVEPGTAYIVLSRIDTSSSDPFITGPSLTSTTYISLAVTYHTS